MFSGKPELDKRKAPRKSLVGSARRFLIQRVSEFDYVIGNREYRRMKRYHHAEFILP